MRSLAIAVILFISHLFRTGGIRACRYAPSCSEYSVEAFRKFGFFRAFCLMTKRILSCQPFSRGGYEPLNEHRTYATERSVKSAVRIYPQGGAPAPMGDFTN